MDTDVDMKMEDTVEHIDESLYSRQLYAIGKDAMLKMQKSNILIIGLSGLGCEIAKNIVLSGVKSVMLYDNEVCRIEDMASNFYLHQDHVTNKVTRADAVFPKVSDLNSYVRVEVEKDTKKLSNGEYLRHYHVVVLVGQSLELATRMGDMCHDIGVSFICCEANGVFGNIFVDNGEKHICLDRTGEDPATGVISSITNTNPAVITVVEDNRHGLETGESISLSAVRGIPELNQTAEPLLVKEVIDPYTFSIDFDAANCGAYEGMGVFSQVKIPFELEFRRFSESLKDPEFVMADFAKIDRPPQIHLLYEAAHEFTHKSGKAPVVGDMDAVVALAEEIAKSRNGEFSLDKKIVKQFLIGYGIEISPICAIIGGITSQEALKSISGKFMPIKQWLYFDMTEAMPSLEDASDTPMVTKSDHRYAPYERLFGEELQKQMMESKCFVVGAGAIGCEVLKNFSLMGIGCGAGGHIHVTDMDAIERSNLNRQFLFDASSVGKLKSEVAAAKIREMNEEVKVTAYSTKVEPATEKLLGDDFYTSLNFVCNALDNVESRLYMDSQCVNYGIPLLESGTLGAKGNTQVIVPYLTESYASSRDPPEKGFPICTLKNFPYKIEHTIAWGKSLFVETFHDAAESVNSYLTERDEWVERQRKVSANGLCRLLGSVFKYLVVSRPLSFKDCVEWARTTFEDVFHNQIAQLIHWFPKDFVKSSGERFWSHSKRMPTPIVFDAENAVHMDFIISASNLYAELFSLKGTREVAVFKDILKSVHLPEFVPTDQVAKGIESTTDVDEETDCDTEIEDLLKKLPPQSSLAGFKINVIEFEKDDDTNFHMDFITAASNLRATNYSIENESKYKTKLIAGKIVPALVTTTSVVCGLVCLELYKIFQKKTLEEYKNGFVNLALPFFDFAEPVPAPKHKMKSKEFTLWDKLKIEGDLTLGDLIEKLNKEHDLQIDMITCGIKMVYNTFMLKPEEQKRRLGMMVSQVVADIAGIDLQDRPYAELICVDEDDECDVPPVVVYFNA